jgi:Ca2+-transporting ATPase
LSLLPAFFPGWPLLLLPVHIVFLELIIDPSCSLVFEAEEAEVNVMRRPPRNPKERLFSLATVGLAVLQGVSALAVCLGVFLLSRGNHAADASRALTFATLVVSFLAIILANRSWTRTGVGMLRTPNSALWWVIGGTVAFLALVLMVPGVQGLFHFASLHPHDLLLSLGAGVVCVAWFEALKLTEWWARWSDGANGSR